MIGASILLFFFGLFLAVKDYRISAREIEGGIRRNHYGEGSRTEEILVRVEHKEGEETNEKKQKIPVDVSERVYTTEEIQEVFRTVTEKMDGWILGENESPDRIEYDLNLLTEIPGQPVDVSWELDRYDVMNIYGELNPEKLVDEGTQVELQAVLTYRERTSEQALYTCTVRVYPPALGEEAAAVEKIKKEIEEQDQKTATEPELELPRTVDGQELHYYRASEQRGWILMGMAVFMIVLFYAREKQNAGKELEKRRRQMRLDHPEIVSKLSLLLGAGMTVKRAWMKIVEDYKKEEQAEEKGRKQKAKRYAYEEMCRTLHEMDGGVTEAESYERFGRRCDCPEYLRLGALLSQNLRKGTKGLNELLQLEAVQAFENRKAAARRMGEEAGTKLLLPMFLMLAVVLVIVIVPAFQSMY